jgi:transposase
MQFIGIDLHTNRFTCCYLNDTGKEKRLETFCLSQDDLPRFCATLTPETVVLIEATVNTFAFAKLFQSLVKEVIIANTYQLKTISITDKKTDKIDAEKLARMLKLQFLGGEQLISPVTIPPKEIRDLRALFATYRVLRKQVGQTKNRIHSLLKENLYPFTKEYVFGKKTRKMIRSISQDPVLSFQINFLMDTLEQHETTFDLLETQIKRAGEPFIHEIDILTSMTGISVISAIAIVADIISISRFKNSKKFAAYLRSTPRVESSNEKTIIKSTNKAGRKVAITLLSQSLNHFRDANPRLNNWYTRLSEYKKKGVVRMALCRRVFTEIFQMLKKDEYHRYMNEKLHEKKMSEYKKFLDMNKNYFQEKSKNCA